MFKSLLAATALTLGVVPATQAAAGPAAFELPRAPLDVPQAFERLFNAADLDGLVRLYAPGGVFVPAPGVQLRNAAEIRGALGQFLGAKLPIELKVRQLYATEQTALIVFDWVMQGKGPDGQPVRMGGTGADVVSRQPDGTWLYVVDNPFGVAQPAP